MDLKKLLAPDKLNAPMKVADPPPKTLKIGDTTLSRFEINAANLMKRAIILSAPPLSGKTVLIKSMLLELKGTQSNVIFILMAPTNTLGTKVMPECFWIDPGKSFNAVLDTIVMMQKERYKMYAATRDLNTFLDQINALPFDLTSRVAKGIAQVNKSDDDGDYEASIRTQVQYIMYAWLKSLPQQKTQYYLKIYKTLFIEPQLVIVIDDLSVYLKSSAALDDLFTNYRHNGITLLVLTHGFTMFKLSTRNNAKLYIASQPSDILWLIDTSKISNKATREFIEAYGTKISSYPGYRLFMVLDRDSSDDIQIQYVGALSMVEKKLNSQPIEMKRKLANDVGDPVEFVKNLFNYLAKR